MGLNALKTNFVCDAGAAEERQPARTVKEEEKEKTLMSSPTEKEEHSNEFLTQWKQELKMLEDWLNNPEPEKDCQDAVMQRETGCQHEEQLEEAEDMQSVCQRRKLSNNLEVRLQSWSLQHSGQLVPPEMKMM